MRPISVSQFKPISREHAPGVGPAPQLEWLPIARLVVDDAYQRRINKDGQQHVRNIALAFDWRLFAPVLVAPAEGGVYAIIDGQHRVHAAALRGLERVPCQIVQADAAWQARAFSAMNGRQMIRLAPYQVHRASLASGDKAAQQVETVLKRAGCSISTNVAADKLARGETVAVQTIYRLIRTEGAARAELVLTCIAQVGEGNPGLLNALTIGAYAAAWRARPDIAAAQDLLDWLDDFDLAAAHAAALLISGSSVVRREALAQAIIDFVEERPEWSAARHGQPGDE